MSDEDDFEYDFDDEDFEEDFADSGSAGDDVDCDSLSVEELFELALTDRGAAWNAIWALQRRATAEAFERAQALCLSYSASEREVGVFVLQQFGSPARTRSDDVAAMLHEMLRTENDVDVLRAILVAFSHNDFAGTVDAALDYAAHSDADVREAVVSALTGRDDSRAIAQLIELSTDLEADIRNWATFALGTQSTKDEREIPDALAARIDDPDDDTRGEALIGLARRKDERAIAAIRDELRDRPTNFVVEAAGLTQAREFTALLIRLRGSEEIHESDLEEAIMACSGRAFEWN